VRLFLFLLGVNRVESSVRFITFAPSGKRCRIMEGDTVLMAAKRCGVKVDAACFGSRCCGRCKVRIRKAGLPDRHARDEQTFLSPLDGRERTALSRREILEGWRLACMAQPLTDVLVEVPALPKVHLIPTASGKKMPVFECNHAGSEEIPPFVIRKFGASYWDAYQLAPLMSAASALIADSCGDPVCKLPFCVTIEAGAFGAEIRFPEQGHLPLPGKYLFAAAEELVNLPDIDFSAGRIHEVLESVRLLHAVGRRIVLKVEAPFTVLSMLMDSAVLFRALRRQRHLVEAALTKIRRNLVRYIALAFANGVDIISYADPSGVIEFVGPKTFCEVSGRETVCLLHEVENLRPGGIVHICGKTSTSLEYMGLCHFDTFVLPGRRKFADALLTIHDRNKVQFTGHNCILVTAAPVLQPEICFLHL